MGDIPSNAHRDKSDVIHIGVKEIFNHQHKDIAIIRLNENVNLTEKIQPICLPSDDNYNLSNLELHVCQKSHTHSLRKHSVVKSISVIPLSDQDCRIMFKRKNVIVTDEEFCAWDETGDTCTGDLGGPLVGKIDDNYHIVGLNSYVNAKVI